MDEESDPHCRNHPDAQARWLCLACRSLLCSQCVSVGAGGRNVRVCTSCGGVCEALSAVEEDEAKARIRRMGFWQLLPQALAYPVRGRGKFIILVGAIVLWLVEVIFAGVPIPALRFGATASVGLIVSAIVCAYLFRVIARSALAEPEPPDWPTIIDLGDWLGPFLYMLAALVLSFGPALAWAVLTEEFGEGMTENTNLAAVCVLAVIGSLYLPMGLLAMSLHDSLAGLTPLLVFRSVAKVAPPYLAACAVLYASAGLGVAAVWFAPVVPVVGPILGWAVSLYLLILGMHVLGLVYWVYSKRLNWFPEG